MEIATRRREQEVWQACDDLWASNGDMKCLTGDAIREHLLSLGKSRGSPNEIYRYRKTWMASRGIDQRVQGNCSETTDDPISRAVRMVHEKLKSETDEEKEKLRQECEQKLSEKEYELTELKQSLQKVVSEFSEQQTVLEHTQKEIKQLQQKHGAEIEIRQAVEHELKTIRSVHEQSLQSHETVITEIKAAHAEERKNLQNNFSDREKKLQECIDRTNHEKKLLGQEYSEQLTEIKTVIYNKEIELKQLEKKLGAYQEQIKSQALDLEKKNKTIQYLQEELRSAQISIATKCGEERMLKEIGQADRSRIKCLEQDLKKTQLRLRTARLTLQQNREFNA